MTTTSRGISMRSRHNRASHTPGKEKGGFCVRKPAAMMATSSNPYKGQGLKGSKAGDYLEWWARSKSINGVKS